MIGLIALVGLGTGIILLVNKSPSLQNVVLKLSNTADETNANQLANQNTNPAPTETPEQQRLIYVARNFAEQFGSGTNQNNSANLREAQQWGTKNFNDYLNRQIALGSCPSTPYRATVTKVLVVNITKQATTTAAVTIGAQREETIDQAVTTYTQNLLIDLLKQGDDWKVNAATWAAR
jgi:hypothetical protein